LSQYGRQLSRAPRSGSEVVRCEFGSTTDGGVDERIDEDNSEQRK
jgi:hypothetical protein